MTPPAGIKHRLVEANDSVLVVIDMQDSFFAKYDRAKSQAVIAKAAWLLRVASLLDIPVVAMAEDIPHSGSLNNRIAAALPQGVAVHDKDVFGLGHQPEIRAALDATGRRTAVLIGTETDVCVAHSALSLMEAGYEVVVLKDVTLTTQDDEDIGLMRMRDAGAVITSAKAIYFEWLRSVSGCLALLARAPEIEASDRPPNLVL